MYQCNTIAAFTVHLARPIDLGSNDKWEVGVTEITYSPKNVGTFQHYMIVGDRVSPMYRDLISPQFVGTSLVRILRTFTKPTMSGKYYFDNVFYVPVKRKHFRIHESRYEI
jgi:hypothetical protein